MLSNWENTPAATLLRFLADLMLVNLLLLCYSLGVVTIGAALTGMYAVLFKRQREDGSVSVLKTFFGAFADNFLWATALEGIVAALLLVAGVDFSYALTLPQPGKTLFIVIATTVAMLLLTIFLLAFPQQAVYRNSLRGILKNSLALAVCAPLQLLLAAAAWAAPWVLAIIEPDVIVYLGVLYLLWGFSFPAYCTVRLLDPVFQKITREQVN